VLLGIQLTLGNSRRNLAGLAIANANGAVAVAHNHESCEAEGTTTLVDLGHTVDGDYAVEQLVAIVIAVMTTTATLATTALSATTATAALAVIIAVVVAVVRSALGVL
jgi:hypothetical protein